MLRPLLVAISLLTRLPVRLRDAPTAQEQGLAVACYPLVGLVIGGLLCASAGLLDRADAPPLLSAVLIVTFWAGLTGALHLDGLADSADAWLGAHGNRDRALAIMKDPACGPAGVVSLTLVLLAKVAAIAALLRVDSGLWWLLAAPVLGRSACAALFPTLNYARGEGLATAAMQQLRPGLTIVSLLAVALLGILPSGVSGFVALAAAGLTFILARHLMRRQIGGFTGDTAGATIEVVETTALATFALLLV